MKQLLILLSAVLMFSCNAGKKITTSRQTQKDSTGAQLSVQVEVKKKDSTATAAKKETKKTNTESGYSKTKKTVREYYSDEFAFGNDDDSVLIITGNTSKKDSGRIIAPKTPRQPYMKETIIEREKGYKKTIEDAAMLEDMTAKTQGVDSSQKTDGKTATVSDASDQSESQRSFITVFPWYVNILILALVVGIIFYFIQKR